MGIAEESRNKGGTDFAAISVTISSHMMASLYDFVDILHLLGKTLVALMGSVFDP